MTLLTGAARLTPRERNDLAADHVQLAYRRADKLARETGLPADEARSAAMLGLAEAIDRYRPELENPETDSFAPFALRTIDGHVREAARQWRWRRRGEPQAGRDLVSDDHLAQRVPDTLTTAELAEARVDIHRALAALTPLERRIVLLRGKLGYSKPAVATMLEIPFAEVDTTYRRAIRRMRERLGLGANPA